MTAILKMTSATSNGYHMLNSYAFGGDQYWLAGEVGEALGYKEGRHMVDHLTRSPEFTPGTDYVRASAALLDGLKKASVISSDTSELILLTKIGVMRVVMTSKRKNARNLRSYLLETVLNPGPLPQADVGYTKLPEYAPRIIDVGDMQLISQHLERLREAGILNQETVLAHKTKLISDMTGWDFSKPPNFQIENVVKPIAEETPVPTGAKDGEVGLTATVDVASTDKDVSFVVKAKKDIDNYWSAHTVGNPYGLNSVNVGKIAREQGIFGKVEEGWGKWVEVGRNQKEINQHYCYGPKAREALHPHLQNAKDLKTSSILRKQQAAAEKAAKKGLRSKKPNGQLKLPAAP